MYIILNGKFIYTSNNSLKDPLHSVTSTFFDSTSQHGKLNALRNSLYRQSLVTIYVVQWV